MGGFNLLSPNVTTLVASATYTGNINSAAFAFPSSSSVTFVLNVTTITGTQGTLDVGIQFTPDAGTTWITLAKFAQITTVTAARILSLNTFRNISEAGVEFLEPITGTTVNTTTAVSNNVTMPVAAGGKTLRVTLVAGGTSPSFVAAVYAIIAPRNTVAI